MDTRTMTESASSQDALVPRDELRAAADRLEQQQAEIVSLTRRLRDLGRELLLVEAYRLQLEARNRELLARCDLLACELAQVGGAYSMRRDRPCGQANS